MKNMVVGKKEIKLLLYLGGVAIALLVYQFYFSKAMDRNTTQKAENMQLQSEVQRLEDLKVDQKEYESDTKDFEKKNKTILMKFPAEVREEDAILYAKAMQDGMSMPISTVGMTEGVLVYTYGQGATDAAGTATAPDTATTGDTTEADAQAAADGQTTEYADGTQGGVAPVESGMSNLMLYKMPVALSYTVEYGNMKRCLDYVKGSPKRCSIDTIALSFDSTTGNLIGTMNLGMYYLTGADKVYETPKVEGVEHGTSNIFGTVQ